MGPDSVLFEIEKLILQVAQSIVKVCGQRTADEWTVGWYMASVSIMCGC